MNKAIFLDRDGVINHDYGYVFKDSDFLLIDGVIESLLFFQNKGFKLIIITNQSGIGRGFYTKQDFENLNTLMLENFYKFSIKINGVYYCPHSPEDNCNCRKPKNTLIEKAIKEHNIDNTKSYLIGDKDTDIIAGLNSNIGKCLRIIHNNVTDKEDSTSITFDSLQDIVNKWEDIK